MRLPKIRPISKRVVPSGKSIDARRAEIADRLERIANARSRLGLPDAGVSKLQSTFDEAYRKATSGYWRGGLSDGFWRHKGASGQWGLLAFVGDQTNIGDSTRLTPSAKRFQVILEKLCDALANEQDVLEQCIVVARKSEEALRKRVPGSEGREWGGRGGKEVDCLTLVRRIESHLDITRETIASASKQVVPEKKHYGKRFWISTALFVVSVGIAVAGLIASGGVVAAALALGALIVTTVIRLQSLASIRGYDRDRGWKSIEGLLAETKHFLETEGEAMKTHLLVTAALERLEIEKQVWQEMHAMRDDLRRVESVVAQDLAAVRAELARGLVELKQNDVRLAEGQAELRQMIMAVTAESRHPSNRPVARSASGSEPIGRVRSLRQQFEVPRMA
ncbi:hypothetical protein [Pandoraea pnomenusa]|uniref:hypothetical protein n=1 Tax=Pandoraea pnomenusa TaxID=93220 RepID=UPI00333E1E27